MAESRGADTALRTKGGAKASAWCATSQGRHLARGPRRSAVRNQVRSIGASFELRSAFTVAVGRKAPIVSSLATARPATFKQSASLSGTPLAVVAAPPWCDAARGGHFGVTPHFSAKGPPGRGHTCVCRSHAYNCASSPGCHCAGAALEDLSSPDTGRPLPSTSAARLESDRPYKPSRAPHLASITASATASKMRTLSKTHFEVEVEASRNPADTKAPASSCSSAPSFLAAPRNCGDCVSALTTRHATIRLWAASSWPFAWPSHFKPQLASGRTAIAAAPRHAAETTSTAPASSKGTRTSPRNWSRSGLVSDCRARSMASCSATFLGFDRSCFFTAASRRPVESNRRACAAVARCGLLVTWCATRGKAAAQSSSDMRETLRSVGAAVANAAAPPPFADAETKARTAL
mmetsp:Transcript_18708/g.66638  ORF Transcript_18708/g.66638 Transcript_18708/m.66638 type:complete len:407 (+) Transcript_18708:1169-2389(+)